MPYDIACPGCKVIYHVPHEHAGKRVRCKQCQTSFLAPPPEQAAAEKKEVKQAKPAAVEEVHIVTAADVRPMPGKLSSEIVTPKRRSRNDRGRDEKEDEPRRRKKSARKKSMSGVALVLLLGGGLFAFLVIVGVVTVGAWWLWPEDKKSSIVPPLAQFVPKNMDDLKGNVAAADDEDDEDDPQGDKKPDDKKSTKPAVPLPPIPIT